MSPLISSILLLLLALAPGLIWAQAVCEPFDGAPQPCQSFLVGNWSSVLTAPSYGYSQESIHSLMLQPVQQSSSTFLSLLDLLPTLEYDCGVAFARTLCLAFFSPCNASTASPVPVCRSVCLNYLNICGASALADLCNQSNPITGSPIFSDSDECATNGDDFVLEPFIYPCPKPLKYTGDQDYPENTGLPCKIACKQQLYATTRSSKFEDLFIDLSVFSWVSLFASLAVIVVHVYFPPLREYPSRTAIFVAIGSLCMNIAWVGNSVQDPEQFMCDDNGIELATRGWCSFSGFMMYFGGMVVASWWWIQVMAMTYVVGFMQFTSRLDQKHEWVTHVWAWGYSLVSAMVLTFVPDGRSAGTTGSVPWCLSSFLQPLGLEWGLFVGVIIFYLLCVIVGMTITLSRVVKMGIESRSPLKAQVAAFLSIFFFGIWFLVTAVSMIALLSQWQATLNEAATSVEDLFSCWLTTNGPWRECQKEFLSSIGLQWWFGFMVSATGIVVFIIFIPLKAKTRETMSGRSSSV